MAFNVWFQWISSHVPTLFRVILMFCSIEIAIAFVIYSYTLVYLLWDMVHIGTHYVTHTKILQFAFRTVYIYRAMRRLCWTAFLSYLSYPRFLSRTNFHANHNVWGNASYLSRSLMLSQGTMQSFPHQHVRSGRFPWGAWTAGQETNRGGSKLVISDARDRAINATWWRNHTGCHCGP